MPRVLQELDVPIVLACPGKMTASLREYSVSEAVSTLRVQTMAHHARSVYLGHDDDCFHYFAKGVGWCLAPGWHFNLGSTGILPSWAAERERDMAFRLRAIGIECPEPIAIYRYQSIPAANRLECTPASAVADLDGSPARPALYVYRHRRRYRLADIPLAPPSLKAQLRQEYWVTLRRLRDSILRLQAAGGHDYSLSLHNVWDDGSRVDFEYVHLGAFPHPNSQLSQRARDWQDKEWLGFRCLAFELADLVGMEAEARLIEELTAHSVNGYDLS